MLLASLLAAALVGACPSSVANDLRPRPAGSQLITVEAATAQTTHATLRSWRRSGRCWIAVGGPTRPPGAFRPPTPEQADTLAAACLEHGIELVGPPLS